MGASWSFSGISQADVDRMLKGFINSTDGIRAMNNKSIEILKQGYTPRYGKGKVWNRETMSKAALDFAQTLMDTAASYNLPPSVLRSLRNIRVYPAIKIDDTTYEVDIEFTTNLHRESLYQEGYPDGIDNIVALYNNGIRSDGSPAKDYVYGNITVGRGRGKHTERIRSTIYREGLYFMQAAVQNYLKKRGTDGIRIILNPIYEGTSMVTTE